MWEGASAPRSSSMQRNCWSAGLQEIKRPERNGDRTEAFPADAHGRDHVSTAEMAMDETGKFLAMRVQTQANLGAYPSTFSTMVPSYLYAFLLAGQYSTPDLFRGQSGIYQHSAG